jgi:hypothetical protein
MNTKSAWYLITSDEIEQIRARLRDIGHETPASRCRIDEMLDLINSVQERLA